MVDVTRKIALSKAPVSLGMYRSLYTADYGCQREQQPPTEEHLEKLKFADSQLKAKEFAVPQGRHLMNYWDHVDREGKEVTPRPCSEVNRRSDEMPEKQEGSSSRPELHQQAEKEEQKYFDSILASAESYLPKYQSVTEERATQKEKLEGPQALTKLEKEFSYSQCPPAAVQTPGTEGMLLHKQKLAEGWATYQQFIFETCRARQFKAQENRSMVLGSSILGEECFHCDPRSTYKTDFQPLLGARGGCCKANKNFSHIFTEDECFNQNYWVSEYEDNYSIFLQRLTRSPQTPAVGLCSAIKPVPHLPHVLSSQDAIAVDTAQ